MEKTNSFLSRMLRLFIVWLEVFSLAIFLSGSAKAMAGIAARSPGLLPDAIHQRADVLKIVSVLEKRMGAQKLPDKARAKLSSLGDAQIRLIASLSELVSHEGDTQGADIAFLLITALIVLS